MQRRRHRRVGTPHEEAPEQEQGQLARVRAFAEASRILIDTRADQQTLLPTLMARRLAELLGDGCVIRLTLAQAWRPIAVHHTDAAAGACLQNLLHTDATQFEDAFSKRLQASQKSIWMPNVPLDQLQLWTTPSMWACLSRLPLHSLLVTPFAAAGHGVVGSLTVWRDRTADPFTTHDLTFAEHFANRVAPDLSIAGRLIGLRSTGDRT